MRVGLFSHKTEMGFEARPLPRRGGRFFERRQRFADALFGADADLHVDHDAGFVEHPIGAIGGRDADDAHKRDAPRPIWLQHDMLGVGQQIILHLASIMPLFKIGNRVIVDPKHNGVLCLNTRKFVVKGTCLGGTTGGAGFGEGKENHFFAAKLAQLDGGAFVIQQGKIGGLVANLDHIVLSCLSVDTSQCLAI